MMIATFLHSTAFLKVVEPSTFGIYPSAASWFLGRLAGSSYFAPINKHASNTAWASIQFLTECVYQIYPIFIWKISCTRRSKSRRIRRHFYIFGNKPQRFFVFSKRISINYIIDCNVLIHRDPSYCDNYMSVGTRRISETLSSAPTALWLLIRDIGKAPTLVGITPTTAQPRRINTLLGTSIHI